LAGDLISKNFYKLRAHTSLFSSALLRMQACPFSAVKAMPKDEAPAEGEGENKFFYLLNLRSLILART